MVVIYRLSGPCSEYFEEFGEFVADLVTNSDKILILWDFTIYLNKPSGPLSKAFLGLLELSCFIQLVHEPTKSSGNILDLILSHGLDMTSLNVTSGSSAVLDHFLITWQVSLACPCTGDTNVFSSYQPGNCSGTQRKIAWGLGSFCNHDRTCRKVH